VKFENFDGSERRGKISNGTKGIGSKKYLYIGRIVCIPWFRYLGGISKMKQLYLGVKQIIITYKDEVHLWPLNSCVLYLSNLNPQVRNQIAFWYVINYQNSSTVTPIRF